mgnify:CR=1 FL=1
MTTQNTSSINSRSGVISRRIPAAALAIALGAGVVAVPQFTEAAPIAHAQEVADKAGISDQDIKFVGLLDKEGNKVTDPISKAYKNANPDAPGTVVSSNGDYALNWNVDLTNVKGGDRIRITPLNEYTPVYTENNKSQNVSHNGLRLYGNVKGRDIVVNGTAVGTVDSFHGGSLVLTFNDAVNGFKSGTARVTGIADAWDSYEGADETSDKKNNKSIFSWRTVNVSPDENGKPKNEQSEDHPTDIAVNFMSLVSRTPALRNRVFSMGGTIFTENDGIAKMRKVSYQAPMGADYEVTLVPNNDIESGAKWKFKDGVKPSWRLFEINDDFSKGAKLSESEAKEKYPDLDVSFSQNGQNLNLKATGVPENTQVVWEFKHDSGSIADMSYQPNKIPYLDGKYTPLDETAKNSPKTVSRTLDKIPPTADMPENEGQAYTRTAEVTPMIAGLPKSVGVDAPAPVAGTKQTFEFEVHNTGDTYMAAPEVTLPNGKNYIAPNVKIGPGKTGVVSVPYDVPADATRLDFGVDFPGFDLNAKEHTFRIGPVDHSEEERQKALDDINKNLKDQHAELVKQTDSLKKQADSLNKQVGELEKIKSELAKANKLSEEMNNKLQLQIDESKKQTDALNGLIKSNNEQTAMLDKQLGELNETQKLQLKESIKQSIDLSRIADALERRNQILIDQHKDQLKQWDIENGFAQDEQNDRKHSMNLKRCMATDPGTPLLFLIPAGLALMFNMPGMQPLVKSASDQIASLNHNIQKATGMDNMLPADLQKNINNFNKQYGDVARAGGAGMAGLIGAVVSAIAISNLVNNCYADADKSVGRETPEPVKLSDSAFSSRK